MFKIIIGVVLGVLWTYAFGALVAWDFNPGNWSLLWRLWCICWAIFWALFGGWTMSLWRK